MKRTIVFMISQRKSTDFPFRPTRERGDGLKLTNMWFNVGFLFYFDRFYKHKLSLLNFLFKGLQDAFDSLRCRCFYCFIWMTQNRTLLIRNCPRRPILHTKQFFTITIGDEIHQSTLENVKPLYWNVHLS